MKKIFFLLLLVPSSLFAQQDLLQFYNCWNAPVDSIYEVSNILFDSHNSPWVIGSSNSEFTEKIAHLNNGKWEQFTYPYGYIISSTIDTSGRIWITSSDSMNYLVSFDGTSFSIFSTILDEQLKFDKSSNSLYLFNTLFDSLMVVNLDNGQKQNYSFPILSLSGVTDFEIYKNYIYFFLNGSYGSPALIRCNLLYNTQESISLPQPTDPDFYSAIILDNNGDIYYELDERVDDHNFSIYKIDANTLTTSSILSLPGEKAYYSEELLIGNDNSLWIGDGSFLNIVGKKNTVYDAYLNEDYNGETILADHSNAIDNKGNLWGWADLTYSYHHVSGIFQFNKNGFSKIIGRVYDDENGNGKYDNGETVLPNVAVYHDNNSVTNSDSAGMYYLKFYDSTLTYNVKPVIPQYWQCQTTCSYAVTPSVQLNSNYDFGLTPIGQINDLKVRAIGGRARPGFRNEESILVSNIGTTYSIPSLTYVYDSRDSFVLANPYPTSINGDTLVWALDTLSPLRQENIQLFFSLSKSVPLGAQLINIASVKGTGNDYNPADNIDSLIQIVVGSFDPNEKTVTPTGNIKAGDWLNYTINFQNTGTDTALTVTVLDTLDASLDPETFQVTGYSHPVEWKIKENGKIAFNFYNIYLPDSNVNEALSHGYVSYRIRSKSGLPGGTVIKNRASIYFDFNSPVVTNTTTSIAGALAVIALDKNGFTLKPNLISSGTPVYLSNLNSGTQLKVIDCLGRILISKTVGSSEEVLSTELLKPGVYIIQCGDSVNKLVIQ